MDFIVLSWNLLTRRCRRRRRRRGCGCVGVYVAHSNGALTHSLVRSHYTEDSTVNMQQIYASERAGERASEQCARGSLFAGSLNRSHSAHTANNSEISLTQDITHCTVRACNKRDTCTTAAAAARPTDRPYNCQDQSCVIIVEALVIL